MSKERKPVNNSDIASIIAANLIMEGGTKGNPLTQIPAVKEILLSLEDIPLEQIKEVLVLLNKNGHHQGR